MTGCEASHLDWVPRGDCGPWEVWQLVVYALANWLIFAAYMALAVILFRAARYRLRHGAGTHDPLPDGERIRVGVAFGAFILACGIGHLEGLVSFWWPHYPTFLVLHAATAAISWGAVGTIYRHRRRILAAF